MGRNKGRGKSRIVPPALRMPEDNESTSFQQPPHRTLAISSHPSVGSTVHHSTQSASISPMIDLYQTDGKITHGKRHKLVISIPTGSYFRPIGDNVSHLTSWIGYCVRSTIKASIHKWERVQV